MYRVTLSPVEQPVELFEPQPPQIAARRSGGRIGKLARVIHKACAFPQLSDDLLRIVQHGFVSVGIGLQENLANAIFRRSARCFEPL